MRKTKVNTKKLIAAAVSFAAILLITTTAAFADGIQSSAMYTGTMNLLNDLSTAIAVLSPIVGGVCLAYCFARKSAADEQEAKMWDHRIKICIVGGIGGMLGSAIIKVISSYYGG